MRLALHTDYALRVLIFLAMKRQRATIREIADFYRISKDHLAKVAQRLSQERLVRSIRGAGGGLELACRPDQIRLGDVIARFEGGMHLLDCTEVENVCVIQPGCQLRLVLAEAERVQRDFLNSVTLANVATADMDVVQLTHMPVLSGQPE